MTMVFIVSMSSLHAAPHSPYWYSWKWRCSAVGRAGLSGCALPSSGLFLTAVPRPAHNSQQPSTRSLCTLCRWSSHHKPGMSARRLVPLQHRLPNSHSFTRLHAGENVCSCTPVKPSPFIMASSSRRSNCGSCFTGVCAHHTAVEPWPLHDDQVCTLWLHAFIRQNIALGARDHRAGQQTSQLTGVLCRLVGLGSRDCVTLEASTLGCAPLL